MRPEARDMFLANVDATAKAVGGTSFQDGIELVRKGLAKVTEMFEAVRTAELLRKGLDELSVTPEQESLLIQVAANGPLLARWAIMKLQEAATDLPRPPNRRPPVTGKIQIAILRYINELHFQRGVELQHAKLRAAQKHGCSVRTVERYWRERKKILEYGPKLDFHELLNELITTIQADMSADVASAATGAEPPPSAGEPQGQDWNCTN